MAEVSESPCKPIAMDRVAEDVIQGMLATSLIDESHDIISIFTYCAHYGYPTPALGRDTVLEEIQPELERHRIFSRGRFGGWKYEVSNQDHSVMQGVELADKLVLGVPEVTYWFPSTANNMKYAKLR